MALTQLLFKKKNLIDTIEVDAIITEGATTSSEITKNPVQSGVDSNDHIITQPMTFSMAGVVSNASSGVLGQFSRNAFTPRKDQETWNKLLELQASKRPFTLVQGLKTYPNVQILSLTEQQDKNTYTSLFFDMELQELIIPGGALSQNQFSDQNITDQMIPPTQGGIKPLWQ
jgi:hypothetical protein